MSGKRKMTIETDSQDETRNIGKIIGQQLQAGDVVCLTGDLGVGKTVLVQGVAEGLGIEEDICSPTFTLIQEYYEGRLPLYHFDVYRISNYSDMDELGYEEYFYGNGVCLVEWGDLVSELFPENTIYITIEKDLLKGFDYRKITISKDFDIKRD